MTTKSWRTAWSRAMKWLWPTASLLFVVLLGCNSGGATRDDAKPPSTLWLVLVDRSQSVKSDANIYEGALRRIVKSVQPGDRFVITAITSSSGSDFRASVDHAVPTGISPEPGILDEPRAYQEEYKKRKAEIEEAFNAISSDAERFLKSETSASGTALFESLLVVSPTLAAEQQRRRVVVILSDMLEVSGSTNFERSPPTDDFAKAEVERQRKMRTLPNLKGVTVCVAGAIASPPHVSAAVEQFWRTYFNAAGASVGPGGYARTLTGCAS